MAAGEVASNLALAGLIELILDTSDWTLALKGNKDINTVMQRMQYRFRKIDEMLRQAAENNSNLRGMSLRERQRQRFRYQPRRQSRPPS